MRHVFHQLYCHFVWHTKDSAGLITDLMKPRLLRFINDEVEKLEGRCLAVNAVTDHVHLLVEFLPKHSLADLIGKVKGASSYHINHHFTDLPKLQWQEGYGAVTLRGSELKKCIRYLETQEQRHARGALSMLMESVCFDDDGKPLPSKGCERQAL